MAIGENWAEIWDETAWANVWQGYNATPDTTTPAMTPGMSLVVEMARGLEDSERQ